MTPAIELDLDREFPIRQHLGFFNHAGVAPLSARAAAGMRDYARQAETLSYHQSDWYERVREVKGLAARLIGAQGAREIAFIPNTSTGLATVAKGLDWREGDNVVLTSAEYPANRYPWEDLRRFGVELIEVEPQPDGRIDADQVADAVTNRTRVVTVSHVQFSSGHRLDLRPISDMVHRAGGYLCVDAIQSLGALPVDVEASGIDFLSADGHKWLLAPEGCGIFYCRADLTELLHPNVVGWMNVKRPQDFDHYHFEFAGDARRFEPGSYNVPGILGLGASLELFLELGMERVWARLEALTDRLCAGLCTRGYEVFSPREAPGEKSGIVSFEPPLPTAGREVPPSERIVADLEQQGLVLAIRGGRLRASPHFYMSDEHIDRLVQALP